MGKDDGFYKWLSIGFVTLITMICVTDCTMKRDKLNHELKVAELNCEAKINE